MHERVITKMFQWTPDYAVGVPQINQERQNCSKWPRRCIKLCWKGKARRFRNLLSRLVKSTIHHFAHEERLMERIGYPDYRQHQIEHAELCSKVRRMQDRSDLETIRPGEILRFLGDWLKYHTTTSDRRIGAYMTMSGTHGHGGQHRALEFREQLSRGILVADGAMGTVLYSRGVFINRCFDELNLSSPDLVRQVHRDYAEAGAQILETNTYGANLARLAGFGFAEKLGEINAAGVRLAREDLADRPDRILQGQVSHHHARLDHPQHQVGRARP